MSNVEDLGHSMSILRHIAGRLVWVAAVALLTSVECEGVPDVVRRTVYTPTDADAIVLASHRCWDLDALRLDA